MVREDDLYARLLAYVGDVPKRLYHLYEHPYTLVEYVLCYLLAALVSLAANLYYGDVAPYLLGA